MLKGGKRMEQYPTSSRQMVLPRQRNEIPAALTQPNAPLSRRTLLSSLLGLMVAACAPSSAPPHPAAPTSPASVPQPRPLLTYHGHTNKVIDVAWSPDGTRILSGSADETVQVWKATTGDPS